VLSPSSARSEICAWEVEEAIRLGKRILPVLCRPLDGASPPPQLADLNYIFFYEEPRSPGSGFGSGLVRLVAALNTDLDWLREHTRYLQRASEWDAGGRPANRLLSGADIASAKAWAASRPKDAPEPTALHLDFIRASEAEESRQQSAEAQRLREFAEAQAGREVALREREAAQEREAEARRSEAESQKREAEQARRVVRRTRAGLAVALVLATAAGWFGLVAQQSANDAKKERDRAQRGLDQIVATANRRVLTLALRLQEEASHPSRGDPPAAPVTPLDHGVDGRDHALNDALDQTTQSAKLSTNGDDIGALRSAKSDAVILEEGAASRSQDAAWQLSRLAAYDHIAQIAGKLGNTPDASAALSKALDIAEKLAKDDPSDVTWQQSLAVVHEKLGDLGLNADRLAEAESHFRSTLELRTKIAESLPSNTEFQHDLSVTYGRLFDTLYKAKRYQDALDWLQKDIKVSQSLSEIDEGKMVWQCDLASSYQRLGRVLEHLTRVREARDAYQKSIEILEAIIIKDPSQPAWQRDAAGALDNMGKLIARLGDTDRAVEAIRHALSMREQAATSFEVKSWQEELEAAYRRASEELLEMGRARESLETAEQYLLVTSVSPDERTDKPEWVARALGTVCWAALFARDFHRASWAGRRAVELARWGGGVELAPKLRWLELNYAHALMFSDRPDEATATYQRALAKWSEAADAIRKDFTEMKSQGLAHKQMEEIELRLKH
jgi:tetratricopeptide (TPR) repeat protein